MGDDAKLMEEFSKFGEALSATVAVGYRKRKSKSKKAESEDEEKAEGDVEEKTPSEPEEEKEVADENAEPPQNGSEAEEEVRVKESLGYGFVSFAEHEGAAAAVETLNGTIMKTMQDGEEIEQLYVGRAQKKAE